MGNMILDALNCPTGSPFPFVSVITNCDKDSPRIASVISNKFVKASTAAKSACQLSSVLF